MSTTAQSVSKEKLAELQKEFGDDVQDLILHLRASKVLKSDQGLESLRDDVAMRILKNPRNCRREIEDIRQKRAEEARAQEKWLAERDARRRRKERAILESVPPQFRNLSAARSPRPRQFQFVLDYFDDDIADAREEKGETTFSGLFLTGKSGSGKSSASYALYQRMAIYDWVENYPFRRSVEFVRLTKSKHLSGEAKASFEREFELLRDTDGIIFLDDLGTEKFVDTSAEDVLFDLFDSRTSWNRRTVVTTNYSVEELAAMFSPKNREKMLRRFNQFFLTINFDRK